MKHPTIKGIFSALGYLWGSVLLSLVASLGFTLLYRLFDGGLGNAQHLIVGAASLMVQLSFVMASFVRYGYRKVESGKKEILLFLGAGGILHLLVSLPFHFSMYTGGTAALYFAEYIYRLQNPKLPAELPFTDIPMVLCLLCFLVVEALAVAAAYVSVRRGQNKRHKEREELQSRPQ